MDDVAQIRKYTYLAVFGDFLDFLRMKLDLLEKGIDYTLLSPEIGGRISFEIFQDIFLDLREHYHKPLSILECLQLCDEGRLDLRERSNYNLASFYKALAQESMIYPTWEFLPKALKERFQLLVSVRF